MTELTLRQRCAPVLRAWLLIPGLLACGQVHPRGPTPDPIVGAWSLDLAPVLAESYPGEDLGEALADSSWTFYFDSGGDLTLHRLLEGQESLRSGQWSVASRKDRAGVLRLDLEGGETGLECPFELEEDGALRIQIASLSSAAVTFTRIPGSTAE